MIQTKVQFNLSNAKEYFREHLGAGDYYSEGQKVTGEWIGHGAEKLGLKGSIGESDFIALCEGKHPETGLRLGQRMNSTRCENEDVKANRRIFYDFTIAPPKSVSVVGLTQDNRIVELHERAVRLAMTELEKRAATRIRKAGQKGDRVTANLITATFRHETSRELDPHLHTHCVVFNATFDPVEKRWKALETSGMYRVHRYATNLYRHELSKGLRALGYRIENNSRGFEIKGVPQSVIDRFSKRHQQIDEETSARLKKGEVIGNVKDLRERVAHGNRRRKLKNSTAEALRSTWSREMQPEEISALKALWAVRSLQISQKTDLSEIMAWAEEHVFERRAVVAEHELMAAALERGRGEDFDLVALREAIDERGLLREKDTDKITSREVLRYESAVVIAAHDGRNQHAALNPNYRISPELSAEQTAAVEKILRSRDFVTLFRGGAGTGKSFALKEVERGLIAANRPVVVLAPQRQQVQDLQADGLKANTLASFLQEKQLAKDAVVIVDEAGQIGARQMAGLFAIVRANQGRLILSGDSRQHGSVAASDALRAIEKHAGLKPAVIQTIRRQDPKLGRTAEERAFIGEYRQAVKAASEGNIAQSFDTLDKLGCIREAGDNLHQLLVTEYLAALERKEKALIVAQTREEVRQVNEAIRDKMQDAGKLGPSVSLQTYQPVDLDEAQKRDARYYESGHHVGFIRGYGRFTKGEICPVIGANEKGVVLEKDGVQTTMSYRYADRFVVATAKELAIAPGDRLQLKFNGKAAEGTRLNNGELVTVRELASDGSLVVEGAKGIRKTLGPSQRLLVRGYAVTSYGSQGKTVDTVLMADAANRAATNANQWYVTISRGRKKVLVFTPDKAALRAQVQQSDQRELALDLKLENSPAVDVRQSMVNRHALTVAQRVHRHQAALRMVATQTNQQRIHL